ncbi:hypothetical protein JG688_00004116 [Phytophthora aleatoria]|uniref:Uncharacterized protein n=1 Tax=Phytophthora aleatoria TaxID=2496075 RepID=A0A8J5M7I8_9STRA|nr:hypothetical protein JG688_00004116 [Phytophthora aleatoria]
MEMPTVLTPYQRMRELLSVKGLGRAAGPRVISPVDDLQTYLRSDRSEAEKGATQTQPANVQAATTATRASPIRSATTNLQEAEQRQTSWCLATRPTTPPMPPDPLPESRCSCEPTCNLVQMIQWFEKRDARVTKATCIHGLHALRQEHQADRRATRRRHKELIGCIAALRRTIENSPGRMWSYSREIRRHRR